MKRIAREISSFATQYQNIITDLFTRFSEMPNITREWIGQRAEQYVSYVMLDKQGLLKVGDQIKDFSDAIIEDANVLDACSSKARKEETDE